MEKKQKEINMPRWLAWAIVVGIIGNLIQLSYANIFLASMLIPLAYSMYFAIKGDKLGNHA